jgi:hypothetical protein
MKLIGGEYALEKERYYSYFTDSGRSSIRLFLRNFPKKKLLIPNFNCKVVVDLLKEEDIEFEFYHINEHLEIDIDSVNNKQFDVLYIINYFGKIQSNLSQINDLKDVIILEDNVFLLNFSNVQNAKKWYGFNSYRKISELGDGSIVKTNLHIENLIKNEEASFVKMKYIAKEIKYDFIDYNVGLENDYLTRFDDAEKKLERQSEIFMMSNKSHKILLDLYLRYNKEQDIRRSNYMVLSNLLKELNIEILNEIGEFSFFIIKIKDRNLLRKYLFKENIFLPIHWPYFGVENKLYHKVLSIPVFSCYSNEDMKSIARHIKDFFKNQNTF